MSQHIDNLFKEKLQNLESQPSQDLWQKIEKNPSWTRHLHRQNARNLIIYTALGIAAIGISTAIILNNNKENLPPTPSETITTDTISDPKDSTFLIPNSKSTTPTPSQQTQNPSPETPNSTSQIPNSKSTTHNPTQQTQNPSPETQNSKFQIPNSKLTSPNSSQQTPNSTTTESNSTFQTPNSQLTSPNSSQQTQNPTSEMPNSKSQIPNSKSTATNSSTEPTEPVTPQPTTNTTSPFSIPNAFTPNGDGLNDVFTPQTERSITNYQIDIYTMGGQHVFNSKNLSHGWNGEYQGGLMTGGTYVYIIKYRDTDGTDRLQKGQFLLIR